MSDVDVACNNVRSDSSSDVDASLGPQHHIIPFGLNYLVRIQILDQNRLIRVLSAACVLICAIDI